MIVEDIQNPRWAAFVEGCEAATPFHHPAWAGLLATSYGYRTRALMLEGESADVVAGLPVVEARSPLGARRWISLPFTDSCPPLVPDASVEGELARRLADLAREKGIEQIEVRGELISSGSEARSAGVVHTLALSADPEEVRAGFKKTQIRQPIGQAERAGVVIERATVQGDLTETFYSLHLRTRRRLGVPVQPRRFFSDLWDRIVEPGLGFVLIARLDGVPIAAAVFLAWNGTVIYKYSASDRGALRARPNHLLLWNAIRWGCENGYHSFDFGRTDAENEGLREFKRGWGTEEKPLLYSFLGGRPLRTSSGRLQSAAGAVIRRSPPFVCRAVGELLYKYAG
ncbi:MAG: lipid II:glycine glycyltransferase FemX [Gaiellaceae bacterium]